MSIFDNLTGKTALREEFQSERKELEENFQAELARIQGAVQFLVEDAMYEGAMPIQPEELVARLGEYDSQFVDELINLRQWDAIGGLGMNLYTDYDQVRDRAIRDSRYLATYSPLATWILAVWTNYGMGDSVRITPNNDDAKVVFDEFWNAERNSDVLADDNLQYLSQFTLQDGNTFLVFFASKADGMVTVDEIPCDEIVEIITNPMRSTEKLFYKRVFKSGDSTRTIYYPDYKAKLSGRLDAVGDILPEDAERADVEVGDTELINDLKEELGTDVVVMHIAHNRKERKSLWGWPILTSASPYIKSHKRFLEDRLTVAASKAMYTRNKKIVGGSRAIADVKSTLASTLASGGYSERNPAAPAGSVELDNTAITTTEKPMTTGASDAKTDGEMFSWIALLGGGLFPQTAGMDTQRWATALAMDKTLAMQWSRYQTFWTAQFQRIVTIVLQFAEEYGGESFVTEGDQADYGANVSIDTLSLVDFPDVVKSLSQATRDMLEPYLESGIIPEKTGKLILRELWLIMLQALGLQTSSEIASKDAFEIQESDLANLTKNQQLLLRDAKEKFKDGNVEEVVELMLTGQFAEELGTI